MGELHSITLRALLKETRTLAAERLLFIFAVEGVDCYLIFPASELLSKVGVVMMVAWSA